MPRRGVLYTAQAIVFAAVTLTISLITSFVAFFVGQAVLSSKHYNTTLAQALPNMPRRRSPPRPNAPTSRVSYTT
jgi:hypothetical protein